MAVVKKPDGDDVVDAAKAVHRGVRNLRNSHPVNATNDAVNGGKQAANGSPVQWGNIAFTVPWIITPVANGVTKLAATAGKWTGLKSVENWGTNANSKVNELSEATIGQVAKKIPGSKKFGEAAANASSFVGDGLNKAAKSTGFSRVAPVVSNWNFERHVRKLTGHLENVESLRGEMPESVQAEARALIDAVKKPNAIDALKFGEAHTNFSKALEALEKPSEAQKQAIKNFNKVIKTAGKAVNSHSNVVSLSNIGSVVKELPQGIAKSQVIPGVMNTAFIGMSAVGMYGVAQGFSQNLASLKEMYTDVTGKKASTIGVLTGNVPKPIAEARTKLLENFGVSELTGVAGLIASVVAASRGRLGWAGALIPQAAGMAAGAVIGDSIISYYSGFKAAHAAGQKISADDYAQFIGKASPELRVRGGADNAFAKKIAAMYAEENISPQQVLQEVTDGRMMKRVELLMNENYKTKTAGNVAVTPQKSHVAALTEPTKPVLPKKELEVKGEHTSKLVADAMQAGDALTRGGA